MRLDTGKKLRVNYFFKKLQIHQLSLILGAYAIFSIVLNIVGQCESTHFLMVRFTITHAINLKKF